MQHDLYPKITCHVSHYYNNNYTIKIINSVEEKITCTCTYAHTCVQPIIMFEINTDNEVTVQFGCRPSLSLKTHFGKWPLGFAHSEEVAAITRLFICLSDCEDLSFFTFSSKLSKNISTKGDLHERLLTTIHSFLSSESSWPLFSLDISSYTRTLLHFSLSFPWYATFLKAD